MEKRLILAFFCLLSFFLTASRVSADFVAGNSAVIQYTSGTSRTWDDSKELSLKKRVIKRYLVEKGSPLADSVDSFMEACQEYDIDCYLLPAIAGVESSFGLYLMPGSHNPFGWGGGRIYFDSFRAAIMEVGRGLKKNYIDRGAVTVEQIGAIYCEGNTWAGKVRFFMRKLEDLERKELFFSQGSVQL